MRSSQSSRFMHLSDRTTLQWMLIRCGLHNSPVACVACVAFVCSFEFTSRSWNMLKHPTDKSCKKESDTISVSFKLWKFWKREVWSCSDFVRTEILRFEFHFVMTRTTWGEGGAIMTWIASATSYSSQHAPTLPFLIYYSMLLALWSKQQFKHSNSFHNSPTRSALLDSQCWHRFFSSQGLDSNEPLRSTEPEWMIVNDPTSFPYSSVQQFLLDKRVESSWDLFWTCSGDSSSLF